MVVHLLELFNNVAMAASCKGAEYAEILSTCSWFL